MKSPSPPSLLQLDAYNAGIWRPLACYHEDQVLDGEEESFGREAMRERYRDL